MLGSATKPNVGRQPSLSSQGRVWLLDFALAGAGLALYLLAVANLGALPDSLELPAPVFALLFCLTEAYVFHLHFRRQAHAFSLSEFPLVLGLFLAPPGSLVLARVVGSAVALVVRRRNSPLKLAFNLGLFATETLIAVVVFRLVLEGGGARSHRAWMAAIVAVLAASAFGAVMTQLAISLAESRSLHRQLPSVLALGLSAALANSSLGLLAVTLAWHDPQAVWLLAIPLLTLFFAYRAYVSQRQKHQDLERLYGFSRQLQGLRRPEAILGELLWQVRDMFRAGLAEAVLFADDGEAEWLTVRIGPDEELDVRRSAEPDPELVGLSRLALNGESPAGLEESPDLQPYLATRAAAPAMLVRLRGEGSALGTLLVANRLGRRRHFDASERRLLETVASRAGVAIENARLGEQLHRAEARSLRLGRILDESATAFYIVDPDHLRVEQASRAAMESLGYAAWELQGLGLSDVLAEMTNRRLRQLIQPLRAGVSPEVVLEGSQRRQDGSTHPVELRMRLSRAEERPLLLVTAEDISERLRAREAVRESEAKSHFLATMSHELRTPLNSILGFAQLLSSRDFGPLSERQGRYVSNIESSGRQLLDLINDILDLSKIEAGRLEVNPEVITMAGLLDDCRAKLRPLAEEKGIELHLEVEPEVRVWADPRRLRQVVLNLISNAIKFTPVGGRVLITAEQREDSMCMRVSDTGIGIAPEHLATIFDEFTQIDSTLSRQSTGTGLGLPLSRRLVALMAGSLTVDSEPGRGSTFTAILPLEPSRGG